MTAIPDTEAAPEVQDDKTLNTQTYVVVAVLEDGSPALYSGIEVPGMTRQYEATMGQSKSLLDTVSDELLYRAVAGQVAGYLAQINREQSVGERVASAMQERQNKE